MSTQISHEAKQFVDLAYLHDILLPEELDIDRGFNSVGLESQG